MVPMPFTTEVGTKFNEDGSVRSFPGSTVIACVDPAHDVAVYQAAIWAQAQLQAMRCAGKMAFLPPDSFHMTVMDLICDQIRRADRWSCHMPLTTSLAEMDEFFIERLSAVEPPTKLRMSFVRVRQPGIVLALEPADVSTAKTIWHYREHIAKATGVRFSDFERYGFHISLAYNLVELNGTEQSELATTFARIDERLGATFGIFAPAPPQLVFFEDMFAFVPAQRRYTLPKRQ